MSLVHRVVYEQLFGPIPEGYHLHHLCSNRLCANPLHLQEVNEKEHPLLEGHLVGQRDAGELITDDRKELSRPQSPELRHCEHVAERRRGLLGCTLPGHRVSSYLTLRLSGPLRSSVITS